MGSEMCIRDRTRPGHPVLPPKAEKYPKSGKDIPYEITPDHFDVGPKATSHSLETCMSGQGLAFSSYLHHKVIGGIIFTRVSLSVCLSHLPCYHYNSKSY